MPACVDGAVSMDDGGDAPLGDSSVPDSDASITRDAGEDATVIAAVPRDQLMCRESVGIQCRK